jgi:hypothetical protein
VRPSTLLYALVFVTVEIAWLAGLVYGLVRIIRL